MRRGVHDLGEELEACVLHAAVEVRCVVVAGVGGPEGAEGFEKGVDPFTAEGRGHEVADDLRALSDKLTGGLGGLLYPARVVEIEGGVHASFTR